MRYADFIRGLKLWLFSDCANFFALRIRNEIFSAKLILSLQVTQFCLQICSSSRGCTFFHGGFVTANPVNCWRVPLKHLNQRSAVPTFLIRYQIRDCVNFLIKTKSKTETQIWFKTKPNPKPRLRFGSKQNQIQNRDSDLILSKTKSKTETKIWPETKPIPGLCPGTLVQVQTLVSDLDLVLLSTKSESRFWIWFCLEPNLSLGFGFGFVLNQIWVSVLDLVLIRKFTQSRIWYRIKKVGTADLCYVSLKQFGTTISHVLSDNHMLLDINCNSEEKLKKVTYHCLAKCSEMQDDPSQEGRCRTVTVKFQRYVLLSIM